MGAFLAFLPGVPIASGQKTLPAIGIPIKADRMR